LANKNENQENHILKEYFTSLDWPAKMFIDQFIFVQPTKHSIGFL